MRQFSFVVAALLAFMTLAPGAALAFDFQTTGGADANWSESAPYTDRLEAPASSARGSVTVTPKAQFNGSVTGSRPPGSAPLSWDDMGWINPLHLRHTR